MTLRVAVQMDPIETININGDSSFALMLAAQARGHRVYHYDVNALTLDANDRLTAVAHPVTVQRVAGDHFTKGDPVRLDLGRDIDVVLMRQDPPFHMGYITATHLLERIESETLVVNNPRSVRNAPEKVMVLDYRRFMPPTLVTRSVDEVRAFQAEHGAVVVKPIHGNGGKAIFRVPAEGDNLSALFEVFNQTWPEPHMVQPFLPEVAVGAVDESGWAYVSPQAGRRRRCDGREREQQAGKKDRAHAGRRESKREDARKRGIVELAQDYKLRLANLVPKLNDPTAKGADEIMQPQEVPKEKNLRNRLGNSLDIDNENQPTGF